MWYVEEARPMDGVWGIMSTLMGIECWETEWCCWCLDVDSGGPVLVLAVVWAGAEHVEEGVWARREEVWEECVPVFCTFEGVGIGDGPKRH
jgi:hypothetical protein